MTDATGHFDWPGAGPQSMSVPVDGVLTRFYTHPDPKTKKVLLVQANSGAPDTLVKEFSDAISAHLWLTQEWRTGRLR
jgi:hypothetical protein